MSYHSPSISFSLSFYRSFLMFFSLCSILRSLDINTQEFFSADRRLFDLTETFFAVSPSPSFISTCLILFFSHFPSLINCFCSMFFFLISSSSGRSYATTFSSIAFIYLLYPSIDFFDHSSFFFFFFFFTFESFQILFLFLAITAQLYRKKRTNCNLHCVWIQNVFELHYYNYSRLAESG